MSIFKYIQNSRTFAINLSQLLRSTNRHHNYKKLSYYKSFEPKQNLIIEQNLLKANNYNHPPIQRRNIHLGKKSSEPKTPDLIYFPHVLRWLKTKMKFKYLKNVWDPTFSEGAFIYGSTQAVCKITEIINNDNVDELNNLLTTPARIKLVHDMKKKLTKNQREIIRITPKDIKILVPMSVELKNSGNEKNCKVALRVLALKWYPQRAGYLRLVLVALESEFLKDYTKGIDKEWNISNFDVMECTVLTETPSSSL